jgi:uncharacterized membrane protein YfcA
VTLVEALLVALACAGGAVLQATVGFGFALLAAPILVHELGATEAVGLLGMLSVLVNTLTLLGGRSTRSTEPRLLTLELLRLAPPAAAGLVAGALLLGLVSDAVLQAVLAVMVLAALAVRREPIAAAAPHAAWRVVAGFGAGALTTTIGVNGPPLVLWLRARGATPDQLRTTLAVAFLVAGAATVAVLAAFGDLRPEATAVLVGAGGVLAGHTAGRRRAATLAVARHERLVTGVLAVTALAAAVSALAG